MAATKKKEKKNAMAVINQNIKSGEFAKIYLLYGKERERSFDYYQGKADSGAGASGSEETGAYGQVGEGTPKDFRGKAKGVVLYEGNRTVHKRCII